MHIYLLRHAQAVDYTATDHERVLSARGVLQSNECGEWLHSQRITVDHAIVSDAQRTVDTWRALALDIPAHITHDAYNASARQLEQLIRECGQATSVIVVAHNPGISELAASAGLQHSLKTCEFVHLTSPGVAHDFSPEICDVVASFRPSA